MRPTAIHHVFPFDHRHFDYTPETWWGSSDAWPVGAALSGRWRDRTLVHVLGEAPFRHESLVVHAGTVSGPGRSIYGHDLSLSLLSWSRQLRESDVVFVHDPHWPAVVLLAEITRARLIGVYHGNTAGQSVRLAHLLERHVSLRPEVSEQLQAIGVPTPRIVELIPSVNQAFFRRRRIQSPRSPAIVGFVGRPREWKGIDTVVDAVCRISADGQPVRLEIAGARLPADAAAVDGIEQRLSRAGVQFLSLGVVSHSDMPSVMEGWDVLAVPSPEEGCPRAVLEAEALCLPVVGIEGVLPKKIVDGRAIRTTSRQDFGQTLAGVLRNPPQLSYPLFAKSHAVGADEFDSIVLSLPAVRPRRHASVRAIAQSGLEIASQTTRVVRVRTRLRRRIDSLRQRLLSS